MTHGDGVRKGTRLVQSHCLHEPEETLTACRNALEAQRQVFALAPQAPASRTNLDWRYLQLGRKLCELGRLDEAEACFRERQALSPESATGQAEVVRELRKWAAQVGKDKDHLSPPEQQERQRYLDLGSRLERQGSGAGPAVGGGKP